MAPLTDAAGSALPPDSAVASSYLINPAHTNAVAGSTLRPPLTRLWTASLTGAASYPLIADGRVFVTSATASTPGGTLTAGASIRALDASTGSTIWSAPIAGGFGASAYDGGGVFTVDGAGTVTAYDAATGAVRWSKSMSGPVTWTFDTVPTAYRGVLYTSAAGDGGTLFAYDEATGALLFQNVNPYTGDESPPALADDGLVVAYGCEQTYKLDRLTGSSLWHYSTGCGGGGGDVPVLAGNVVYVTDPMSNVKLDRSAGASLGTFTAAYSPAIDGTLAVFANGTQLTAVDTVSGQTAWTYGADNNTTFLATPLLAGGCAYTVDTSGKLTAFDTTRGAAVWSDTAAFVPQGAGIAPAAMTAAGGLLVVPEGNQVVAYTSSPDAGSAPPRDASPDGACTWTMQLGQEPSTGYNPNAVAIGDLDGDGNPDLAVTDFDTSYNSSPVPNGSVSVLLGHGDGTFQAHVDYTTDPGPRGVAIADLNHDGKLDLAVANGGQTFSIPASPGSVSILLGNGDGTFAPKASYPTGSGSTALVVGDLNGDGHPDIAVANDGSPILSILIGNGDGTFQAVVNTPPETSTAAVSIAIADLNGDGHPDLVTTDDSASVDVFINQGSGAFATPVVYETFQPVGAVSEPDSVAVADLNGDHKLDLAVANRGGGNVSVFLGKGDGTFQAQVPYATNRGPQSVAVADLDGDRNVDLTVVTPPSPDVSVLLGNGDGTFQPQVFFAFSNGTFSTAIADVNHDGRPDVVGTDGTGGAGVLLGRCRQ